MAQVKGPFQITGSLGNLSFYERPDLQMFIVRRKGGASKHKVKYAASMAGTRQQNSEFAARAKMASIIRRAVLPLGLLLKPDLLAQLNLVINAIQKPDQDTPPGGRAITISRFPGLLEGFSISRHQTVENIISSPLKIDFDLGKTVASVIIPALVPGINFFTPPGNWPFFSISLVSAFIPDLFFAEDMYRPAASHNNHLQFFTTTGWMSSSLKFPEQALNISNPLPSLENKAPAGVMMLCMAVCFTQEPDSITTRSIFPGAGKILAMRPY